MSATLQAAAHKPAAPADRAPVPGTPSRRLVRARSRPGPAPHPAAPALPWLTGDTTGRGLRWTHGGTVAAAVGKVFFSLGGADYVCSGTLAGGARPVVATAAHCVSGGPGARGDKRWATHWLFVPGYREGAMPYGEFTAQRFLVEPAWTGPQGGSEQYDVSFVQITGIKPDGKPSAVRPPARPAGHVRGQPGRRRHAGAATSSATRPSRRTAACSRTTAPGRSPRPAAARGRPAR